MIRELWNKNTGDTKRCGPELVGYLNPTRSGRDSADRASRDVDNSTASKRESVREKSKDAGGREATNREIVREVECRVSWCRQWLGVGLHSG